MDKPKPKQIFDSVQVRSYLKSKHKLPDILHDIVNKIQFDFCNGSVVGIAPELLSVEDFPQLTKKEREYITVLLREFSQNKKEVLLDYWW